MSVHSMASSVHDQPSPRYTPEPPPILALRKDYITDTTMAFKMKGHSSNPNFEVSFHYGSSMFNVETIFAAAQQYTFFTDGKTGAHLCTLYRQHWDGKWRYTIHTPGNDGVKLLEFDTKADMLTGTATSRLIFRDAYDGELDALDLRIVPGSDGNESDVLYKGKKVAEIHKRERSIRPEFSFETYVAGIDPLLLVIMAVAIDDRMISKRRRGGRGINDDLKLMAFGGSAIAGPGCRFASSDEVNSFI